MRALRDRTRRLVDDGTPFQGGLGQTRRGDAPDKFPVEEESHQMDGSIVYDPQRLIAKEFLLPPEPQLEQSQLNKREKSDKHPVGNPSIELALSDTRRL